MALEDAKLCHDTIVLVDSMNALEMFLSWVKRQLVMMVLHMYVDVVEDRTDGNAGISSIVLRFSHSEKAPYPNQYPNLGDLTFVIDVQSLGMDAVFPLPEEFKQDEYDSDRDLRFILEVSHLTKLCFDVTRIAALIYKKTGIRLGGIDDVQLLDLAARRRWASFHGDLAEQSLRPWHQIVDEVLDKEFTASLEPPVDYREMKAIPDRARGAPIGTWELLLEDSRLQPSTAVQQAIRNQTLLRNVFHVLDRNFEDYTGGCLLGNATDKAIEKAIAGAEPERKIFVELKNDADEMIMMVTREAESILRMLPGAVRVKIEPLDDAGEMKLKREHPEDDSVELRVKREGLDGEPSGSHVLENDTGETEVKKEHPED